jgi:diguanylate cyclase (GGDEF)-like protein/PAS domain S-box-containing protein
VVSDLAAPLLGLLAGIAVLRAVPRVAIPRARLAWGLVAVAVLVYAAGDGLWSAFDLIVGEVESPSLADAAYVAYYPLIVAALLIFPSRQSGRSDGLRLAIDSAIVLIGGAIVVLHTLFGPALTATYPDLLSAGLAFGYPIGDLVLLFGVAATTLRRPTGVDARAMSALLLSLVLMFLGDVGYGQLSVNGSLEGQRLPDVLYLTSSLLIALAGFLQANPAEGSERESVGLNRWLLVLPYAGLAGGYGILIMLAVDTVGGELAQVLYGSIALTLLVLVRQELVLRENSRMLAEHAQNESEARFRALTSNTSEAIVLVDRDGIVAYATPEVERVLGLGAAALVGRPVAVLGHADDSERIRTLVADVVAGRQSAKPIEWRLWDRMGIWRQVETVAANLLDDPRVGHIVLTTRDVGERKTLQGQLAQVALHDRLTGLPNRALFRDRVEQALASADRAGRQTSILILGLDGLKRINDSLGLAVGDQVIQEIARRLQATERAADTCARLVGDEFGILLDGDMPAEAACLVAERTLGLLREPIGLGLAPIHLTASVGVATAGPTGGDASGLLRSADVARSVARDSGGDRIVLFEPAMQEAVEGRFELEAELRVAIARNELVLQYQPIVDLWTGELVAAEALVRWEHPTRGRLGPGVFIPLAEEIGLIDEIGTWVLHTALHEVGRWARVSPGRVPRVSVNVAARQLADPQLAWNVQAAIADANTSPSWITLEVTESVFVENTATVLEQMHAIRALGVEIALDDFGTGYSSLAYLQQFPVSYIKIDRSFVTPLDDPARKAGIAGAVVEIGKALGMATIAEGIETPLQLERLRAMGCTLGQGFLLSRPLEPDAMAELVRRTTVPLPSGQRMPGESEVVPPRKPRTGRRTQQAPGAA